MIPEFPEFKKLTIHDRSEIEHSTRIFPAYSDFNFVSLWMYNLENDIVISKLNNNLVIQFKHYLTREPFLSFIGLNKPNETINQLFLYAKKTHREPLLQLVPELVIKNTAFHPEKFTVKEDLNNHDYILSIHELTNPKGKKHGRKNRSMKKFQRDFPTYTTRILDVQRDTIKNEIKEVVRHWVEEKEKNSKDGKEEVRAVDRLLEQAHMSRFICLGIYHADQLVAFSISEPVHDGYVIGHAMKASKISKHVYDTLYFSTAHHLSTLGSKYLNIEQDLGIDGLRRAKQLWGPIFYLKKYTIAPKLPY